MAFLLWGLLALALGVVLVFFGTGEFLVPAVAAMIILSLVPIPGLSNNYFVQIVLWLLLSAGGLLVFRNRLRRLKFGRRRPPKIPSPAARPSSSRP